MNDWALFQGQQARGKVVCDGPDSGLALIRGTPGFPSLGSQNLGDPSASGRRAASVSKLNTVHMAFARVVGECYLYVGSGL